MNGNNSPRRKNHSWHLLPQQQARHSHLALSHRALAKSKGMCVTPNLEPHQKTPAHVAVERARGDSKGLAGISTLRHICNGCTWDNVKKHLCLAWVWPWLLAHRQEGPLQHLTCPGRTEVMKSMPTNKLWPSLWAAWDTAPDRYWVPSGTLLSPRTTWLDWLSPSIPS